MPKSWAYGDVAGSSGGRTWPDSFSFCDRWCGLSGGLFGAQCRVPRGGDSGAGAAGSVVDSLVAKVEEMDQLLGQLEQLSDLVAEVERDTAVRLEQAESSVNHVDELARRGQAELEGQLKQLTDTMEVRLHEHLSEFKDTSLEVADLGVKLEMRRREVGDLTSFVVEGHSGGGSASRRPEGEGAPC